MNEQQLGFEAEQAVLGSMLIEIDAVPKATLHVKEEDFLSDAHRRVLRAILALYAVDQYAGIDIVTVAEQLRQAGDLDAVGGTAYLSQLQMAVTTAAHVEHYARKVKNASLDRRIKAQFRKAWEAEEADKPKELSELTALVNAKEGNAGARLFDFRTDIPDAIEELLRRDVPVLNTGFAQLDAYLCGLRPGELITVGARTSGGKTAFMTRVCLNMAQDGHEALFITSEMRELDIVQRILPQAVKIPSWKFRKRALNEDEEFKVRNFGVEALQSQPIKMLARGRISLEDIRRAVVSSGCKVVFIDYLQRCRFPKAERESSAIYEFMAELKEILLNTGAIGFIGSQLDRERDKEPERRPVLRDFRGSAGIESESDVCLMLWKPPQQPDKMDYVPPPAGCVRVECVIGKARGGISDLAVDMDFNGEYVRFAESSLNSREEGSAAWTR